MKGVLHYESVKFTENLYGGVGQGTQSFRGRLLMVAWGYGHDYMENSRRLNLRNKFYKVSLLN